MKRIFLILFCCGVYSLLSAQSSSIETVSMKEFDCLKDGFQSMNAVSFEETHLYIKNNSQRPTPSGSRAVTTVELGSAGNLFTILEGSVNRIATNNDLNTVAFIHRTDPSIFPLTNVGQYRYDASIDGGATWTLNHGVLNPKGNQVSLAGRYPNNAIYNPAGNTNPDSAYMAYLGPWLPFDVGGDWDGIFTGVARLDHDTSTFTENIMSPNNSDVNIVRGMCNGAQGIFWGVDWAWDEVEFSAILVYKGIWNPNTNDVDWSLFTTITPPFDRAYDGTSQATALNMSFDPTGQYGWIGFSGDVTSGGLDVFTPTFYQTVDGGNNWTGPIVVDLSSMDNVVAGLDPAISTVATTAFDADIVVDANGNPHYAVVVGSEGTGQSYSITTGVATKMKIYDITKIPGAEPGCEWTAIFLDTISTFRGQITVDISEDNRPQASRTDDGSKVFFGWLDSDPNITGSAENVLPNLRTRAIDVTTGLATDTLGRTEDDGIWGGGALFASFSPNCFESGGMYNVPTVLTELNASGSDADPTKFHYVQDINFMASEFTMDVYPPVITLLGTSPTTVMVNTAYGEPGATALDNLDGIISGNIQIDASDVDESQIGSYAVTYNVTDSAGNIACEVIRVVNVVAAPDNTPPVLSLNGNTTIDVDICSFFADPGATASDDIDGDITANIDVTSNVPAPLAAGSYTITYDVSDGAGNTATTLTRTVNVSDLPPDITLNGDNPTNLEICNAFTDLKGIAFDNCAGSLTLTITGSVDINTVGTYTLTYTADDGVNPPASVDRIVNITADVTPPSISVFGSNPAYVYLGTGYSDAGAIADDCADGNLSGNIVAASTVDTSSRGIYTVTYDVSDSSGNAAQPTTRTVVVGTEPDPGCSSVIFAGLATFTDESDFDATGWLWDFGDGFASNQQNPTHRYTEDGVYTVCLRASNVFNDPPFNKIVKEFCKDINLIGTGIQAVLDGAFDLYPNPTTGKLTIEIRGIEFQELKVTIHDLLGKEISGTDFDASVLDSRVNLDMNGLADGIYAVRITTDLGVVTKKISLYNAN